MLNSVRNHLGDLHGVGLRSWLLRKVSVSPYDNGVPKWLGPSSTPAPCLLQCIDRVIQSTVLPYWARARNWAKGQTKTYSIQKAVPSVLAAVLQYYFFDLQ